MRIGTLTSAARTALSAIDVGTRKVDGIAQRVAAGIQTEAEESTAEFAGALAKLPTIKSQVRANARVVETAETLLNELAAIPRR